MKNCTETCSTVDSRRYCVTNTFMIEGSFVYLRITVECLTVRFVKLKFGLMVSLITRGEDMWREGWSGCVFPCILNFDTRWR
jgi:hypothetical protein